MGQLGTFALVAGAMASAGVATHGSFSYPAAARVDQVDDYHGIKVADPYRWLEELDSAPTRTWIEAQNKLTEGYLDEIAQRAAIKKRLTKLWSHERYGIPSKEGRRYYYQRNDGLQNQSVVWVAETLEATPKVFLDPNAFSADGTVSLGGLQASDDGRYVAYALSDGGSDWQTWKVRDLTSGADLPDEVRWSKFSGAAWTKDSKGFYYTAYDAPVKGQELKGVTNAPRVQYHVVGTGPAQDRLVYQRKDQPEWYLNPWVTDDGRYLIIPVNPGRLIQSGLFYQDLEKPDGPVVELLKDFDAQYRFVGNDGAIFFLQTDLEAPRGRIIAIDTRKPQRTDWLEVVPQKDEALQGASLIGNHFVVQYLKDAQALVRVFDLRGQHARDVDLPGIGSVSGFSGKKDDPETFYMFETFTTPETVYRYDVATGKSTLFKKPQVEFDPAPFETRQVFYNSKDGTRIPMFLTCRKSLKLDGSNPTLLYGYGGFSIAVVPSFSASNLAWLEMGGVLAVANLRGGSEYGEDWHKAGTKLNKQNVFDDFIAAAEWLIANKYTTPAKLAINGRSNGGLLVGAVMTQRPELFGAALPGVGVLDMMRFHKFTVGWGWVGDYGSSDDLAEAKALLAYSPYHNVKTGACYPPTMVYTADHDDRVYPAHSFKFAAALQHAQSCGKPALIRIETRAGHGAATPTSKKIEEAADLWTFLVRTLAMEPDFAD